MNIQTPASNTQLKTILVHAVMILSPLLLTALPQKLKRKIRPERARITLDEEDACMHACHSGVVAILLSSIQIINKL